MLAGAMTKKALEGRNEEVPTSLHPPPLLTDQFYECDRCSRFLTYVVYKSILKPREQDAKKKTRNPSPAAAESLDFCHPCAVVFDKMGYINVPDRTTPLSSKDTWLYCCGSPQRKPELQNSGIMGVQQEEVAPKDDIFKWDPLQGTPSPWRVWKILPETVKELPKGKRKPKAKASEPKPNPKQNVARKRGWEEANNGSKQTRKGRRPKLEQNTDDDDALLLERKVSPSPVRPKKAPAKRTAKRPRADSSDEKEYPPKREENIVPERDTADAVRRHKGENSPSPRVSPPRQPTPVEEKQREKVKKEAVDSAAPKAPVGKAKKAPAPKGKVSKAKPVQKKNIPPVVQLARELVCTCRPSRSGVRIAPPETVTLDSGEVLAPNSCVQLDRRCRLIRACGRSLCAKVIPTNKGNYIGILTQDTNALHYCDVWKEQEDGVAYALQFSVAAGTQRYVDMDWLPFAVDAEDSDLLSVCALLRNDVMLIAALPRSADGIVTCELSGTATIRRVGEGDPKSLTWFTTQQQSSLHLALLFSCGSVVIHKVEGHAPGGKLILSPCSRIQPRTTLASAVHQSTHIPAPPLAVGEIGKTTCVAVAIGKQLYIHAAPEFTLLRPMELSEKITALTIVHSLVVAACEDGSIVAVDEMGAEKSLGNRLPSPATFLVPVHSSQLYALTAEGTLYNLATTSPQAVLAVENHSSLGGDSKTPHYRLALNPDVNSEVVREGVTTVKLRTRQLVTAWDPSLFQRVNQRLAITNVTSVVALLDLHS